MRCLCCYRIAYRFYNSKPFVSNLFWLVLLASAQREIPASFPQRAGENLLRFFLDQSN
jgi:hypothetical protein